MAERRISLQVPFKKSISILLLTVFVYILSSSFKSSSPAVYHHPEDSVLSKQAFLEVYKVLMSPRCMNCHPAGDVPLQGDESVLHRPTVKRGKDGKGTLANRCINCHMETNELGVNGAPGNPKWQLPPQDMKMVFQGKSARELAAQLLDTAANGNKSKEELVHHIAEDTLVLAGWHPAKGFKMPPLSHEDFTKQFKQWLDNGAYLPD